MKITVITLFPEMIKAFFAESIIKRAQEKGQVQIDIVNLRDFSTDNYKTVDDRPYGGGAGMVIKVDVVVRALTGILNSKFEILNKNLSSKTDNLKSKIVLTSARGVVYNQTKAREYANLDHLVILAGHYEGFDERVSEFVDEEVSIGDFVMTGGEIPAAAVVDSVVRLLPDVLKKDDATQEESFFEVSVEDLIAAVGEEARYLQEAGLQRVRLLEYPHYTRPEDFMGKKVPDVLLSGNHADIQKWRLQRAYNITKERRNDFLE